MLRPRFFTGQPLASGTLTLETGPSRHIARTLRMQPGDSLALFDGSGVEARAVITALERDRVSVAVEPPEEVRRESPLAVTLAVAVSRGDRMDTVVQKSTELGVAHIWPLLSERTGVKLDAQRWEKKRRHWQQVAISACEQCGRNDLPAIAPPASLRDILETASSLPAGTPRLLMHPGLASKPLPAQCASALLLVGPEGGFSDAEVAAAEAAGFQPLTLGPRILRTETAPLVALSVLQARWGDLSL